MQSPTGTTELASETAFRPRSMAAILADLRALAVEALDSGHPLAAAQLAGVADRLQVTMLTDRPPRPSFPPA